MTLHILGSKVHYWQYHADKKPVIVAIHGFRGTHHGLEFIAKNLPQFRVIIPDLPGFGESTPMKNTIHDAENYAEFVRQFIAKLKLDHAPVVLGHSFGSVIAARLAASHPASNSQLILINPIAGSGGSWQNWQGLQATRLFYLVGGALPDAAGTTLLRSRLATNSMSRLLARTNDPVLRQRIHQQHQTHFGRFHSRAVLMEVFGSSIRDTVTDSAVRVKNKTLLIGGQRDIIVPLKSQQTLRRLFQQADLQVIANVGHLIHYETPQIAARHIKAFIGTE